VDRVGGFLAAHESTRELPVTSGSFAAISIVEWIVARPRGRNTNVPAEATSFVGRRHELAEVRKKLSSARLVSIVGPGGVGNTASE